MAHISANTYLQLTEVDFEDIRSNLKSYLSTQTQFQDYDFEGSAMSVLLDVLAYNTHYNAFYANMLANEMFLDTAQQRESVVSRAKELGYLPVSARGASANVTLTFTGVGAAVGNFEIAANSKFTTTIDDITYTYVTPEASTVTRSAANTFVQEIEIVEGEPLQQRYTVSVASPVQYIIPNEDVDTRSIKVQVQESSVDTTRTTFSRATNIVAVSNTSPVFFLHETFDRKYEVTFGDGVVGKSLKNNNIVIIDYRVCNGTTTNGANTFSVNSLTASASYTSVSLALKSQATGGREVETVAEIKDNAPRNYEIQNRAIIAEDFSRILLNENSDIGSVTAYGGELHDPATYGKVFIAAKPLTENFFTDAKKNQFKLSILDRTPIAVDPTFIDADFIYVIPTVSIRFDKKTTTETEESLKTLAKNELITFNNANLNKFKKRLRFSRLSRVIDNIDNSIFGTEIILKLQKRFTPDTNVGRQEILNYKNPLRSGTLSSTQFTYEGYTAFLRDVSGVIKIFRYDGDLNKIDIIPNAGTIDYTTGKVVISSFKPSAYEGIEVKVSVEPSNLDVVPTLATIITIDAEEATITATAEV